MRGLESVPEAARARNGDCVARLNWGLCRVRRWDVNEGDMLGADPIGRENREFQASLMGCKECVGSVAGAGTRRRGVRWGAPRTRGRRCVPASV